MRKLNRHTEVSRGVLELCAESIQNQDLKARLKEAADHFEAAEAAYLEHAAVGALFHIARSKVADCVTAEEMKHVYKNTFVKSKRTRPIYDAIKKLPANDICPMCGQRTVGTLDHYLAQSLHPALALSPANLLPCCADCNKAKLDA